MEVFRCYETCILNSYWCYILLIINWEILLADSIIIRTWYKGKEVDQLSLEEAKIIASNTIKGYKEQGLIKSSFEEKFRADIEKIYTDLFLSISSYKELTTAKYNEIENKIQAAGEKYVGKGNMPKVELCVFSDDACEMDKSCESGKSCCEKQ